MAINTRERCGPLGKGTPSTRLKSAWVVWTDKHNSGASLKKFVRLLAESKNDVLTGDAKAWLESK